MTDYQSYPSYQSYFDWRYLSMKVKKETKCFFLENPVVMKRRVVDKNVSDSNSTTTPLTLPMINPHILLFWKQHIWRYSIDGVKKHTCPQVLQFNSSDFFCLQICMTVWIQICIYCFHIILFYFGLIHKGWARNLKKGLENRKNLGVRHSKVLNWKNHIHIHPFCFRRKTTLLFSAAWKGLEA